jgi:predicted TIM-barrel fold metal-dependent hydrolase
MIPLIALEEHFLSPTASTTAYAEQLKHLPDVHSKLTDLGTRRLADMDTNGISFQVMSHAPGMGGESPETCAAANDQLRAAVKANPGRFAGFAVLPMANPEAAAKELERCVKELGFVGCLVDNHVGGKHYDGRGYRVFFEKAEALDVPVYLHPTWPSDEMQSHVAGNFSTGAAISLGSSGFGWHADTHLHVLKLFAAGVFDSFPRLKIVVGHFGEMLPFQLQRIALLSKRWGNRERVFEDVYRENIWITTSGVWSLDPMACILRNTPIEHILFSVDYPFAENAWGLKFMEELRSSGLVTKEQLDCIGYKNAEKLLKLTLTQ